MVLYTVVSPYQILYTCLHAEKYNKNKEKILIYPDFMLETIPLFFETQNIFDKTIISKNTYASIYKSKDLESNIIEYYDELLKKNNIDIQLFDNIYVAGAHYYLGIYLSLKGHKFNFIEESNGSLSRADHVRLIEEKVPARDIADKLGLFDATSKFIDKIYYNKNTQEHEIKLDNLCHFDIFEELMNAEAEIKENLLELFCSGAEIPNGDVLILSQHFSNLQLMTYAEQVEIYKTFVDYFIYSKKVIFKKHPNDVLGYDTFIKDSKVINTNFMSEFIPILADTSNMQVATISSSGIFPLEKYFSDAISLNFKYEREFQETDKYFLITMALKHLNEKKVHISSLNYEMLFELAKANNLQCEYKNLDSLNDDSSECIIINNIKNKSINYYIEKFKTVILYDSTYLCHISDKYKKCIFPITLNVKNKKGITQKSIYILSDDKNKIERILNMKIERELVNLECTLTVSEANKFEIENNVLKGIIESLETRLLNYIIEEESDKNE